MRPEQIRLLAEPVPGGLTARVREVTYYGHDASVMLAFGSRGETISARVSGHMAPLPGTLVGVVVEGAVMAYAPANQA